ncbi:putative carboxylesterase 3 [Apostasia shenzhenica]|uniref:Putative carboxylesterase 3 n=1 Tax=Apostasia shenzhenica TaxID=1088818 RepID=A0A2I0A300_9ASPA|nr:putative carboxylesterase 3 [Apostasia shenzhenica]
MGLIQNLLLRLTFFYFSIPLPKDSPANVPSAINTAGDATDVAFEISGMIRVYSDVRVERLKGTDVVPPSFDLATGVLSKDVVINSSVGLAARLYLLTTESKLPVLIYFHGGAFCIESPFSPMYHSHLNNLSSLGPLLAVSVNYSLAPEHPLPAAYDDSWTAIRWVLSRADPWLASLGDFRRVYITGDSAGANICHQMALRDREEGLAAIKGMALVDPYFTGKPASLRLLVWPRQSRVAKPSATSSPPTTSSPSPQLASSSTTGDLFSVRPDRCATSCGHVNLVSLGHRRPLLHLLDRRAHHPPTTSSPPPRSASSSTTGDLFSRSPSPPARRRSNCFSVGVHSAIEGPLLTLPSLIFAGLVFCRCSHSH